MSKKTTQVIIESGNHYIIQVKANQGNLHKQIKMNIQNDSLSVDIYEETITIRGRREYRKVYVSKNIQGISDEWIGLNRIIKVERIVTRKAKISHETAYYITSLKTVKAQRIACHIKQHWGIENRLHWVKDVCMKEDISKTAKKNAAANISLLRNITINLFRTNGYDSIKYATQRYANHFKELIGLVNSKPGVYKRI